MIATDRISDSDETVHEHIRQGRVTPARATEDDIYTAIEWLSLYEEADDDGLPISQAHANVIALLEGILSERRQRAATAEAKRRYAAAYGIPVSKVRVRSRR